MKRRKGLKPSLWVGLKPFGFGEQRPNNYKEVFRAVAENRDNARYAWRILKDGCCDGCALGTTGLHDWTIEGVHLCNIRLRLLRLNTMPALDVSLLDDVSELEKLSSKELRALGRLPYPMIRRPGDKGFSRISWDEALDLAAAAIKGTTPDRLGFYLTSRGMPNESYYAAQKAVRAMGTNSIDNAARVCHSPSTSALKQQLGIAATSCSYTDWIGSDLIVFIGSNVANNQPVAMKYLYLARKAGTKVVCINPYLEPGMDRYWIPSSPESAVFGTKITDRFFQINVGGDIAFLTGVLKAMIEAGDVDRSFIELHTTGFDDVVSHTGAITWEDLERGAGCDRSAMKDLAGLLGTSKTAVFVWSMGVTQHVFGEDNVRSIVNLALTKGFLGREQCGVMPIRGHSGVQGGAEMGAYSTAFPGGLPVDDVHAAQMSENWGFEVPVGPGLTVAEMLDAAHEGDLELLFSAGGNFIEVLPDPVRVIRSLANVPLRMHMDICLSSQMFVGAKEAVVLLPAATRYEIPGGVTETSTERRVIFSPEIPGPRIGEARGEWEVFGDLAARVRPEIADRVRFSSTHAVREEIARVIPNYEGIQHLRVKGDHFQYGGAHLCPQWKFPTADGKAHFQKVALPDQRIPEGHFVVATRRGKQFNSMVHERKDALTGAVREAILMNESDARELRLADGDAIILRSPSGSLRGSVLLAPVQPGSLQVHWPEGQVLIESGPRSPEAGIPDYNAVVTVEPAPLETGDVA
ncbi:MAG: FdhF/YdeP family oxidoreductase [Actinobacteria bacterium]|nr:FdhF/YdeP family oxidoreductase [Actinomycetota bacterium]